MVCGGGGVGKTTTSAAVAIAATQYKKRVLVVTIDPAKRLAEALGFTSKVLEEGGAPLKLSPQIAEKVGVASGSELSVGILNPKYVINEVLEASLNEEQRNKLKSTLLYSQMTEMIYGLQEYTAYEWVTRMIKENVYDLIVLDTPPAFHAKDFFNAPEKITRLMESRVFQLFLPKKTNWLTGLISFSWLEKLLGERVYKESALFFETFSLLRDQILERCEMLTRFFKDQSVDVISVATLEKSALIELEGLDRFLLDKGIKIKTVVLNQVEEVGNVSAIQVFLEDFMKDGVQMAGSDLIPDKLKKLQEWHNHRQARVQKGIESVQKSYSDREVLALPMSYAETGFEILRQSSAEITRQFK